jgi:hypothetical protein
VIPRRRTTISITREEVKVCGEAKFHPVSANTDFIFAITSSVFFIKVCSGRIMLSSLLCRKATAPHSEECHHP